jgi:hypothetical protein
MKTIFTFTFLFTSCILLHAQESGKIIKSSNEINNWTLEAFVGQGKGVNPYSAGY